MESKKLVVIGGSAAGAKAAAKARRLDQKAEITALRNALAQEKLTNQKQESNIRKQEERMLQMEMALAELLRNGLTGVQVSLAN